MTRIRTAHRLDRRELRERPYLEQHLSSARQREPRNLAELLHWFLEGFAAETPEVMHARGVWVDRPKRDELGVRVRGTGQGGSLLGSPQTAEPFRQLLENTPRQVGEDKDTGATFYVRPMRAALERLAGSTEGSDSAFMARFLAQVAYGGGDWEAVASRWKITPFVREVYLETALRRLHRLYRPDPPPRTYTTWLDRSDAQRMAELDVKEAS